VLQQSFFAAGARAAAEDARDLLRTATG